jgi:uncharacterized protein YecE (DUF72 family)
MIRVGIGGWTFEPWRGLFYPEGLPHKRELAYASRHLSSIEINGTFYRTQTAASFAKWRDETPDDFVFSVKAPRYATHRIVLGEAGEAIERFMTSGLTQLDAKLGPIVWQFAPSKRFDAQDFEHFLRLLPIQWEGCRLQHVFDVRHESFVCTEFVALVRRYGMAIVCNDSEQYPEIADACGDVVYARLMRSTSVEVTGYSTSALEAWAERARAWERGAEPDGMTRLGQPSEPRQRDVFVYFISGAKERAPAAALALLERLRVRSASKGGIAGR